MSSAKETRRELVQAYSADNMAQAELIRQELEAAGIEAVVRSTPSPLDGLTSIDQGTPILVRVADAKRAEKVVEAFFDRDAER